MDMVFEEARARHTRYRVWELAAIWDGFPEEELEQFFKNAECIEDGVYRYPGRPNIKARCRVIIGEISAGSIPYQNDYDSGMVFYFESITISLYSFIEFINENLPDTIPESMRPLAENIKAKKILETKSEAINPKWENSILTVLATFVEYTMGDHKNLAKKEEIFKNRTNFHMAVEKLYGSITPKTLRKVLDRANAIEKKK